MLRSYKSNVTLLPTNTANMRKHHILALLGRSVP